VKWIGIYQIMSIINLVMGGSSGTEPEMKPSPGAHAGMDMDWISVWLVKIVEREAWKLSMGTAWAGE